MAIDNQINVIVKATDNVSKPLKAIWTKFSWLKSTADKAKSAVSGLATAFVWISAWVTAAWLWLFDLADSVETVVWKSQIVFWEFFWQMDAFAAETAWAMGLSRSEFLKTAAGIQDLLIPMWFTREAATWMTQDMIGLSGALSEWSAWQYTAAEVGDIMAKAMLWEREQLKSLWIAISEEDVKNQMLIDTKKGLTFETEAQAKAIATQTLIMEKSTDAQVAYAEGAETLTRKKAEMTATLWTLRETIAASLLPAFYEVVEVLQPIIEKTAESIEKWFENKENVDKLTATLWVMIEVFKVVFVIIWEAIWFLWKMWEMLWTVAFQTVMMYERMKETFTSLRERVSEMVANVKATFVEWFTTIYNVAVEKVQAITASVMAAVEKVKAAYNSIKNLWSKVSTAYSNIWANISTVLWTDWTRAVGWTVAQGSTYLVGENWPELFTPSTTWNITSNNELWWGWGITINMGWVVVKNEADENRLISNLKKAIKNDAKFYNLWIS